MTDLFRLLYLKCWTLGHLESFTDANGKPTVHPHLCTLLNFADSHAFVFSSYIPTNASLLSYTTSFFFFVYKKLIYVYFHMNSESTECLDFLYTTEEPVNGWILYAALEFMYDRYWWPENMLWKNEGDPAKLKERESLPFSWVPILHLYIITSLKEKKTIFSLYFFHIFNR